MTAPSPMLIGHHLRRGEAHLAVEGRVHSGRAEAGVAIPAFRAQAPLTAQDTYQRPTRGIMRLNHIPSHMNKYCRT